MNGAPSLVLPRLRALPRGARALWPGLSICALVALSATFVTEHQGGSQLLYALLFGMCLHHLLADERLAVGIDFAARGLLRLGVALLGTRISLAQIAAMGWEPVAIVLLGVASTIALGVACARRWCGGDVQTGLLTGGAVAICGASAAMALSAVLPRNAQTEQRTLLTVVGVTALSTLSMVLYPPLARLRGLDDTGAGLFFGGTIHDVAQVIGAGLIFSPQAADVATVVKLLRVAMLVPVVLLTGAWMRSRGESGPRTPAWRVLPAFLVGFIALVLLNSAGAIPPAAAGALGQVSRWCLVLAIAALGIRTSLAKLARVGWRPLALLVGETVWLALLVLALLKLLPLAGATH